MSLRTKLVLAFLLLSVLPLSAIVAYGYVSSTRALRVAALEETKVLASELTDRMEGVEARLDAQVRELKELPLHALAAEGAEVLAAASLAGKDYEALIEAIAPFVESLEFVPQASYEAAATVPAVPSVAADAPVGRVPPVPPGPPAAPDAPAPPAAPVAPAPPRAITIDLADLSAKLAKLEALAGLPAADPEAAEAAAQQAEREALWAARAAATAERWQARAGVMEGRAVAIEAHAAHATEQAAVAAARSVARAAAAAATREHRLLRGSYECPVEAAGVLIGQLRAKVAAKSVLRTVLSEADREAGEIPFAVDGAGNLYAAEDEDWERLEKLGVAAEASAVAPAGDWVVVKVAYPGSELSFGIAKPLRDSLRGLRRAAGRNLAFGLGLVGLALFGVVPLSRHITCNLVALTAGAERLAAGDLDVEVPIRSRDEVGRLARTFNRLARDLRDNQERLVENELSRRLLASEIERKTEELEEARRFQLSLLPRSVPEHPRLEVAVFMRTATEVGGDYYDFRLAEDGALTVAIGDATGHGAKAGTMVTVIKSLFSAGDAGCDLPEFLAQAAASIRRMELGRMAMALALARLDGERMVVSSAGMPPVLVRRASGELEEIALQGLPLGGMAQPSYQRHEVALAAGDIVLLMSDGLPELLNEEGEPFGYARLRRAVDECAGCSPQEIIARLAAAAEEWTGGRPPGDDVTFVVLKVRT